MQSDTEKIVLQRRESVLHILCDLFQNDLILIEQVRSGKVQPEALAKVALNVRSGLYILDGLGDDVQEILASTLDR
jgi:hypothetical protein